MRRLQGGPFLKLQFYFSDRSSRGAFRRLVAALVRQGAALAGHGGIHRGLGVRDAPFRSHTDDYLIRVPISALSELEILEADPDVRLVEVGVLNAVSAESDLMELVTFASVSEEAARRDEHPLALLTEGWMYEGVTQADANTTRAAQVVGQSAYRTFRSLVSETRPAYGSIGVAWHLECPTDLRHDPSSMSFRNFYVSQNYLVDKKLHQIASWFQGCYIEPIYEGLYISNNHFFNPVGSTSSIDGDMLDELSIRVSKAIAFR